MSEMTLEEAMRVLETGVVAMHSRSAHAERTVEARSGEPEAVKRLREAPVWHLVTDYIDTLTAERDAARERSEYWKAEHAAANEVIDTLRADRDRLAACVERVRGCEQDMHAQASKDIRLAGFACALTDILAALGEEG